MIYKALPTLVRLTKKEHSPETRILAADTLAFLIETSPDLQRVAAISNHLVPTVASFLWWDPTADANHITAATGELMTSGDLSLRSLRSLDLPCSGKKSNGLQTGETIHQNNVGKEMKRSAFRVFATLAATDEDIRKKIIETDNLMDLLVISLHETENVKLQMAAVGCLHSLSRSVQLLRTTFQVRHFSILNFSNSYNFFSRGRLKFSILFYFQDHPVWKPLISILESSNSSVECMILASSTLCNLLLEFSPSKEPIVDSGAIDLLCQLTHKYDPSLRLNGVWGLMVRITKSSCTIDVPIEFHDIQEMDFQEAQEIQILQERQENENIQQIIEVDLQVRDVPTSSGSGHLNP